MALNTLPKAKQAVLKAKSCAILFVLIFVAGAANARGPEVYLGISTTASGMIEVAVPEFTVKGDEARGDAYSHLTSTMSSVVQEDLEFSGYFKIIGKDSLVQEQELEDRAKGQINFKEWAALGPMVLIKGLLNFQDGQLILQGELYDIEKEKRIIGVKYSGEPAIYRAIAHKFSDEVIYRLTGERGIASTKIAFISKFQRNKELYAMDYDGHNVSRLTRDGSLVVTPAWSPEGSRIAFTSYIDRNPDLYLINIDGSERKPLSMANGLNVSPAWSPDGKKIAFVMSKDGNPEIYLLDVASGELKRLTQSPATDSSPAWSPDGSTIAFTSDSSGSPQIYLMDTKGENMRRLTYEGNYNDLAAWSPRGDRIAFAGRQGGQFAIYTINPDGSDLRMLTSGAGSNEAPAWSPDGRYIAFSSDKSEIPQIYIMRADGTGQRPVTSLAGGGYAPTWSPRLGD